MNQKFEVLVPFCKRNVEKSDFLSVWKGRSNNREDGKNLFYNSLCIFDEEIEEKLLGGYKTLYNQ